MIPFLFHTLIIIIVTIRIVIIFIITVVCTCLGINACLTSEESKAGQGLVLCTNAKALSLSGSLSLSLSHRLIGLLVRRPPRKRKIPGSNPFCDVIFSGFSHTSDSKIGTPVATLPGAWRYRVSAGTGRPGVSIL